MSMRRSLLYFLTLSLLLAACSASGGVYTLKIVDRGRLVVSSGQALNADVLLLDGAVVVRRGAELQGRIFQILGTAQIEGKVVGDVSQWGGRLTLGPEAMVTGLLSLGGGDVEVSPGAEVQGGIRESETQLSSPSSTLERLGAQWVWRTIQIAATAVLALLFSQFFPRQLEHMREAVGGHPVVSFAMGALVGLVGLTLMVQMAFTILLIPVAMFAGLTFLLAVALGWTAWGAWCGHVLSRLFNVSLSRGTKDVLGTVVFMILIQAVSFLPAFGNLLILGTGIVGLGGVFLTRFGLQQFVPDYPPR